MSDVNYTKVNWQAYPNKQTKLTAANLNTMDQGIYDCATQINNINSILLSQPFVMQELTASDLDNVTTPGYYLQGSSANATQGRHYPCPLAGYLEVLQAGQDIIQKYRPSTSIDYFTEFIRRRYHGIWSTWMSTDFVQLASFSRQSITTAGINTGLTRAQISQNIRELSIRTYGECTYTPFSFGSETSYVSYTWVPGVAEPTTSPRIRLRADGSDPAKIYLLNASNGVISGTIPPLDIIAKLGKQYPTRFI